MNQSDLEDKDPQDHIHHTTISQMFPIDASRTWQEDIDNDVDHYMCLCVSCGQQFTGHKRRMTCRLCGEAEYIANNKTIE